MNEKMFDSVISYGQMALRFAFMANVGAIALIFGLISKVVGGYSGAEFKEALLLFAYGVICIVVATGGTYAAQFLYCFPGWFQKLGNIIHVIVILLVIGSYICLAKGSYFVCFA